MASIGSHRSFATRVSARCAARLTLFPISTYFLTTRRSASIGCSLLRSSFPVHSTSTIADRVQLRKAVYRCGRVNIDASMQGLRKGFDCNVLISRSLFDRIQLPLGVQVENVGSVEVRGKVERLDMCTMSALPPSS